MELIDITMPSLCKSFWEVRELLNLVGYLCEEGFQSRLLISVARALGSVMQLGHNTGGCAGGKHSIEEIVQQLNKPSDSVRALGRQISFEEGKEGHEQAACRAVEAFCMK
jgi:hypothetical protein